MCRLFIVLIVFFFSQSAFADRFTDMQKEALEEDGQVLKRVYRQCNHNNDCTYIKGICGWKDLAVSKTSQETVSRIISLSIQDYKCLSLSEKSLVVSCIEGLCEIAPKEAK